MFVGCNTGDSLILYTQNYSMSEHLKLQKVFQEKFNISSTINKDRDEFRLRFNGENSTKLIKIITPDIIPSMRYKIVPVETESAKGRGSRYKLLQYARSFLDDKL